MSNNDRTNPPSANAQLFDVVAVNCKTGKVTVCTAEPVSHHDACTIKSKFSLHPLRHMRLMPV